MMEKFHPTAAAVPGPDQQAPIKPNALRSVTEGPVRSVGSAFKGGTDFLRAFLEAAKTSEAGSAPPEPSTPAPETIEGEDATKLPFPEQGPEHPAPATGDDGRPLPGKDLVEAVSTPQRLGSSAPVAGAQNEDGVTDATLPIGWDSAGLLRSEDNGPVPPRLDQGGKIDRNVSNNGASATPQVAPEVSVRANAKFVAPPEVSGSDAVVLEHVGVSRDVNDMASPLSTETQADAGGPEPAPKSTQDESPKNWNRSASEASVPDAPMAPPSDETDEANTPVLLAVSPDAPPRPNGPVGNTSMSIDVPPKWQPSAPVSRVGASALTPTMAGDSGTHMTHGAEPRPPTQSAAASEAAKLPSPEAQTATAPPRPQPETVKPPVVAHAMKPEAQSSMPQPQKTAENAPSPAQSAHPGADLSAEVNQTLATKTSPPTVLPEKPGALKGPNALQQVDVQIAPQMTGVGEEDGTRTSKSDASPATPRTDAQVAKATFVQIREVAVSAQARVTEVQLTPEELGRIRLAFSSGDNAQLVSIQVERPETLDLLRRNMDLLRAEIEAAGYNTDDLELSAGLQDDNASEGFYVHDAESAPAEEEPVKKDIAVPAKRDSPFRADGRLDISL